MLTFQQVNEASADNEKMLPKIYRCCHCGEDVGLAEFTEEKYQDYLKIKKNMELILNKGNLFSEENQKV